MCISLIYFCVCVCCNCNRYNIYFFKNWEINLLRCYSFPKGKSLRLYMCPHHRKLIPVFMAGSGSDKGLILLLPPGLDTNPSHVIVNYFRPAQQFSGHHLKTSGGKEALSWTSNRDGGKALGFQNIHGVGRRAQLVPNMTTIIFFIHTFVSTKYSLSLEIRLQIFINLTITFCPLIFTSKKYLLVYFVLPTVS